MIYDEDPFRRRPRKSTARRKQQEKCVWMAENPGKWPSKRGAISKIMPSDGCKGDTAPLALVYRTRFLGHKFVSCGGPE